MGYKKRLFAIAILFGCFSTYAYEFPSVSYLGTENGLSNNVVTRIYQDHRGFMWFGTLYGLNRYDGYEFKIFSNQLNDSNSLIYNRVTAIAEDYKFNVWIGTTQGLSILNYYTTQFSYAYYLPFREKKIRKITLGVNEIKSDRNGNVLIATKTGGLIVYKKDSKTGVQIPYESKTDYNVTSIEFDDKDNVWLYVRNKGLFLYDHKTNTIRLINNVIKNGICLKAGADKQLFLGTDDGVFEFNRDRNAFSAVLHTENPVFCLSVSRQNDLWMGSDGDGIFIRRSKSGEITPLLGPGKKQLLTSSSVSGIYEDSEDRVWIATLRGGINVIDKRKNQFKTIQQDAASKNSLISNFVLSVCEDARFNIWVGTDGGGLGYWDRNKNLFLNYHHEPGNPRSLSSDFITRLVNDHNDETWIATWNGGINRFNKQSRSFEHYSCINRNSNQEEKNVWNLYQDKDNVLWASTFGLGSLYNYNPKKNTFELFDATLSDLITLAEDRHGNFWAGDNDALIKIDKFRKRHIRYNISHRVRAIHEDKAGRFWVGTEGGGLLLFNRLNGSFVVFSEINGLCSNSVLNILEDGKGNLWLSTFNGISKFDPSSKKFTNYSQSNGLQSNQFSYNAATLLHSGELFFGGIKGFNIFYPENISDCSTVPPVFITGVKINNKLLQTNDPYVRKGSSFDQLQEIKLPFTKATLSFTFVALEYSSPDKINYAYFLEGRDYDWNLADKSRTVNYTSLHEGEYTFKVKATNADGIWSNKVQQIKIIVLPPWYRTIWAYALYVMIAIAFFCIYLTYKAQKTKLAAEVAWAKKETEREKELNEKKLSFFTNISHEFRSPLTLIIDPIKEILSHPEKRSNINDLHIVYRNARRLLSLVDQLLLFRKAGTEADTLRIAKLDFSELSREVFSCFSQQAQAKNIQYEFECDSGETDLYVDREKMEIVLFNLLSNALKFTPEHGKVSFVIKNMQDVVQVIISDNGCGIPADTGQRLFEKFYREKTNPTPSKAGFGIGLYLAKQFVDSHKGAICYESDPGHGTQFIVTLQKGIIHLGEYDIQEEISAGAIFLHELAPDASPETAPVALTEKDPQLAEIINDRKSVLIVEDNEEIRRYLVQIFNENFIIYEADNGAAGWELAFKYIPDIIISDVVMNGITGVELCRKIKENSSLTHIPVILLTASSSSDIRLKGIECGADDYITKPFEKELLIARVDNILKSRNALQQYFFDKITLKKNNSTISAEYKEFLEKCIDTIERNFWADDFPIKVMAKEMNMSHSSLYKKVKATSGTSVSAFIRFVRLRKAAILLLTTDMPVKDAAFQVGLKDVKYFRKQFVRLFGISPSEYVKKYKSAFNKTYHVMEWQE